MVCLPGEGAVIRLIQLHSIDFVLVHSKDGGTPTCLQDNGTAELPLMPSLKSRNTTSGYKRNFRDCSIMHSVLSE